MGPHGESALIAEATRLMERKPGYRVEIIGGQLLGSPPPDGPHGVAMTDVMLPFASAGLHGAESKIVPDIGLWLPTGADDYAIPDLSLRGR